jgi:NitT/TauT family transport system substrate-binding protein
MQKSLRVLTLVLAIPALATAGLFPTAAQADTVVTIGAAQLSAGSLPVIVAEQQGLFKAEGITIKKLDFQGGGPAVQALASGSLDLCICAADHAVQLTEHGLGGKVLVALADHQSYALMGLAGTRASSLTSMKNENLGVTSSGSLSDNTLRYAIKQAGLNPDTDFQILNIGLGGNMRAALESKAIVAGMFTTPDIEANLAMGGTYKIIDDFRSMPYPAQDIVVIDGWLKKNPKTARAVASAIVKALQMIQANKNVLHAAVKQMFPKFSPALVNEVTDDVAAGYLSKDGKLSESSFNLLMTVMKISEPSLHNIPYQDIFTLQYLPQ